MSLLAEPTGSKNLKAVCEKTVSKNSKPRMKTHVTLARTAGAAAALKSTQNTEAAAVVYFVVRIPAASVRLTYTDYMDYMIFLV